MTQGAAPDAPQRSAVRLLQGYLWHPKGADLDLENYLPHELGEAHVMWDEVNAPFAFFENGEPSASQTFYQFTALRLYDTRPDNDTLHAHAETLSRSLTPLLEATPQGVGWQLWEDLREL